MKKIYYSKTYMYINSYLTININFNYISYKKRVTGLVH